VRTWRFRPGSHGLRSDAPISIAAGRRSAPARAAGADGPLFLRFGSSAAARRVL